LLSLSCGASSRSANEPAPVVIQTVPQPDAERAPEAGAVLVASKQEPFQPSSDAVPVDADDVVWGAPNAPVTIVQFQDLQCPFCSRVQPTLDALEKLYARGLLRFVLKHNPLPFHKQAHEAARFTQAVRDLAGSSAARSFAALAFANQPRLGRDAYQTYLSQLRLDVREVERRADSPEVHARVEADMALAKRVGLNGTPSFLINGVAVSGAHPIEKFSGVINE
jgi:protein-disulfide isomerase